MPNLTTNYSFNKPLVNDATDEDLWGGYLNDNWDEVDTLLDTIEGDIQLPVGSVFFTTVNTNPATLLGYGTWTQRAQGRFIVGVGQGTDAVSATRTYSQGNDAVGEYQHDLTTSEMPAHTHSISPAAFTSAAGSVNPGVASDSSGSTVSSTGSAGGGDPHENSPPAFGLYVWERTA